MIGGGNLPLVEMRGIEPLSENPLTQLSSWAVCPLDFPLGCANRHAHPRGSPFLLDRLKSEPPMQVHHFNDVQPEVVVLPGGTGNPQVTALPVLSPKAQHLGSHSNSVVVVYFLKFGPLSRLPGSPRLSCLRTPVETIAPPSLLAGLPGLPSCGLTLEYYTLFRTACQVPAGPKRYSIPSATPYAPLAV